MISAQNSAFTAKGGRDPFIRFSCLELWGSRPSWDVPINLIQAPAHTRQVCVVEDTTRVWKAHCPAL